MLKNLFVSKKKSAFRVFMMVAAIMSIATNAFAAGTADTGTVTAVTGAFDNITATALAVLAAIGGVAILAFGGIYAWRYGKKVFSIIAK